MKKRIFAIMLVSMMLALTACGNTSTTNEVSNDVSTEVESTEIVENKEEEEVVESTEAEETVETSETDEVESTEAEQTEVPMEEPVVETPQYTYTDVSKTMYAQSSVNVRDLPSTDGNKLGGLSTNQEVNVTGQCNETSWYRIDYNGSVAYVSNKYLGDSKVEVAQPVQNTQTSNSGSSSSGSNNTLSSCPYPLNTILDDGGDYVYYYYVDTVDSMHGAAKEAMYAKGYNDDNIIWSYDEVGTFAEGHVLKCTMKYGHWGQ